MTSDTERTSEISDTAWVAIDVVMEALGVSKRNAYKLARRYRWRTAPGHYPKQYLFADVRLTWLERNDNP